MTNILRPSTCPSASVKSHSECRFALLECKTDQDCDGGQTNAAGLCCFDGCTYKCRRTSLRPKPKQRPTQPSSTAKRVDMCPQTQRLSSLSLRHYCPHDQVRVHECLQSSDCRPPRSGVLASTEHWQCCFDGCVNACRPLGEDRGLQYNIQSDSNRRGDDGVDIFQGHASFGQRYSPEKIHSSIHDFFYG